MSKVQLYIKGVLFQEKEITLPVMVEISADADLNLKINSMIREVCIMDVVEKMKLLFSRQIVRSNWNYKFYFLLESKINSYGYSGDTGE